MNYVQQQDRLSRMIAAFAAAILLLTLAGAAVPAQAQTYTDLHDFNPGAGDPDLSQFTGLFPQGWDGSLYSLARNGGTSSDGTVYGITLSGTPTVLHSFDGTDGNVPYYGLTLGTDGNFYGAATEGGSANAGTIFKITPTGTFTLLYNFNGRTDGGGPFGPPVEASNGDFYGVTTGNVGGSPVNPSTFYKITPSGTFTTVHTLTSAQGVSCANAVLGSDGNFYGSCNGGGANNDGSLFKITPTGTLTVLHSFDATDGFDPTCVCRVQATDGNFYGVTYQGGTSGVGVIYKLTTKGVYTVLHNFTGGADGGDPTAGLTQGPDGNLYGTASIGGSSKDGVIFKTTTAGVFTVLYNFDGTHGSSPQSNLTLDTDGVLYGNTDGGGADGAGVFFSFKVGFSPFAALNATSGKEGAKIGILGQGFSSSSVVKFGGTKATTIVHSGTTFITATVPAGALTGAVTVTTGTTTLTSTKTFDVLPTITSFAPESGPVGTSVTITGTGLKQTTKVTFDGKSAAFTVISDTEVKADVPTGATTGKIAVTTKGGSATSATSFTVN